MKAANSKKPSIHRHSLLYNFIELINIWKLIVFWTLSIIKIKYKITTFRKLVLLLSAGEGRGRHLLRWVPYLSVIFLWHILASGILIAVFLPAEVVQWLRLARSKGPIWVGVSPPFTWRRKKNQLPKHRDFIFLYFIRTMDKVQKTINSQCHIPSSEPFRIE
jgi:hypothetical protein